MSGRKNKCFKFNTLPVTPAQAGVHIPGIAGFAPAGSPDSGFRQNDEVAV